MVVRPSMIFGLVTLAVLGHVSRKDSGFVTYYMTPLKMMDCVERSW